jgi:hypothetical protein
VQPSDVVKDREGILVRDLNGRAPLPDLDRSLNECRSYPRRSSGSDGSNHSFVNKLFRHGAHWSDVKSVSHVGRAGA